MAGRGLDPERVVRVAGDIADAEGLAAVTVARVAAELGVRGPSIYNHVPGREGLERGVALEGIRGLTATLREAAVGRSGDEALLAAAHAYRDYARAHPGRYEAAQRAPSAGDEEALAAAQSAVEVLGGILRAWQLDDEHLVHAVRALRSGMHGFVDIERLGGFELPVSLDESYERVVRGLAAGLAPTRAAA